MSRLLRKFEPSFGGNQEYLNSYDESDSDESTTSSSSSSSSSLSSSERFTNISDSNQKKQMSRKGLMINIPNYLSKLSPVPSNGSGEHVSRGRGVSLSQRIKDNNLLVNSRINDVNDENFENAVAHSPIDIPIEFKEIIRSRSNSVSRTRTNSINTNDHNPLILTGTRARGNSLRSNTPSMTNLRNIPSSMESINSLKRSNSSVLSNSNGSAHIPMKNLKKYLTTGDDAYLVDGDSDEDLFMNNLSHQQQSKQQKDVMVNMTSSANMYALSHIKELADENGSEIERIRRETKKVVSESNSAAPNAETSGSNMGLNGLNFGSNMGLNFGSEHMDEALSASFESERTLQPTGAKNYRKVTPIELYGAGSGDDEAENIPSSAWFLGGNM